jgi:ribosome-binding protein aMBF1 (putative translation factor)
MSECYKFVTLKEAETLPKRASTGVPGPDKWAADRIRRERERRGWSTGELAKRVTEAGVPLRQQQVWQIESGEPPRRLSVGEAATFAAVFELAIADLVAPPEDTASRNLIDLGRQFAEWVRESGLLAARLREIDERAEQLESSEDARFMATTVEKWFGYSGQDEAQADRLDRIAEDYAELARRVRDRSSVWSVIASMRELPTPDDGEPGPEHGASIQRAERKNPPRTPRQGEQD